TRADGIGLLRSQRADCSEDNAASDRIGTRLVSEYTDRIDTKTYCLTLFLSSSALSVTQWGSVCTELSMPASHCRPSSDLRSPFRSPMSFSTLGKSEGFVLPRLNSVTVWPRSSAYCT